MAKKGGKSSGKYERYKAAGLKMIRKKRDLLKHLSLHPNDEQSKKEAKRLKFLD